MGGDCLNYGCVPSKALLSAAHKAHYMQDGKEFGIKHNGIDINFRSVHNHVHDVIEGIAPHDSVERFESLGVTVIKSKAKFMDARRVRAGSKIIMPRYTVIATGSSAAIPNIPGLADIDYLTNENVFDLTRAPRHIVIIGGGPLGVEMAQALKRLGSEVTILESKRLLPKSDHELAEVVSAQLRKEGIRVVEETNIIQISQRRGGAVIHIADGKSVRDIDASHVLVATGRRPNFDELDLDKAGVLFSENGIEIDRRLRTTNKRVFAIGDVIGGTQQTHAAGYHAGIVIRNTLFRLPAKADLSVMPRAIYTSPEVAEVGLTESEASQIYSGVKSLKWNFDDNDRARAEREIEGLVKIVVSKRGKILGVGIVGKNAGDLITPWTLAMQEELKISSMANLIAAYPTRSEASKRAAGSFYSPALFGKGTRRLVRFLSMFG
jgi:pyruvate/2-oxoglutarate dehydrogenase complex dihydrolipoamide dehydrogenase (E3) component